MKLTMEQTLTESVPHSSPVAHSKLRKDAAFRTVYRAAAIEHIQNGNCPEGLRMLEEIFQATTSRHQLQFDPAELKIWTLGTKYRKGRVHDLIRAGMILILANIAFERRAARKPVPADLEAYLLSTPIAKGAKHLEP